MDGWPRAMSDGDVPASLASVSDPPWTVERSGRGLRPLLPCHSARQLVCSYLHAPGSEGHGGG